MSRHRFEVVPVVELEPLNTPTVQIEHEIPVPPPLPASLASKNSHRISSNLFNTILKRKPFDTRRRATVAAALAQEGHDLKKSSSIDVLQDIAPINEVEESDVYSSIQSNYNNEVNPSKITNKFLHELRLKRHELRVKAKNFTIDQRISLLRREDQRQILRAQDIFAVHFASHDEIDSPFLLSETQLFTEESQEKIRKDIYKELDRQRDKQFDKHYRHLILGRSLLTFMTLLMTFMSFALIYVVTDLYDRASFLDFKLPENEYLPIVPAQLRDYY